MKLAASRLILALGCCMFWAATGARAADPDGDQARKWADQFVAAKQAANGNPQESYETNEVAVADLNGDGQAEIVVWWTMLGPTYWASGLTVLARQGQRYLPAGEAEDALGSVEDLDVRDGVISLKTKWPAPNDPRCCPSIAKTLRYRWQPGRLSPVK